MDIRLVDDGTLDTVFTCRDCNATMRYTFEPCGCERCYDPDGGHPHTYAKFAEWAQADAAANHVCTPRVIEPLAFRFGS